MFCSKRLVRGKSAPVTTSLYELLLHVGCIPNTALILAASFFTGLSFTRPLAIGAWQDWWKPLLQSTEPRLLPCSASLLAAQTPWFPSQVPPAQPRAGCQDCTSLHLVWSAANIVHCLQEDCCLHLFYCSHLLLYLCPSRWLAIPHHWNIITLSFAFRIKAFTLKD